MVGNTKKKKKKNLLKPSDMSLIAALRYCDCIYPTRQLQCEVASWPSGQSHRPDSLLIRNSVGSDPRSPQR